MDWWHEVILGPWGPDAATHERIRESERCWKCDAKRIHDGCAAGLCEGCCRALRTTAA